MTEVRVGTEGNLRHVQASGVGTAWVTASAAPTGLIGYVRNFSWTDGSTLLTIRDRGQRNHHKNVGQADATVTFTMDVANTGNLPVPTAGAGASVAMMHMELKMDVPENAAITGDYYHFLGVAIDSVAFTENEAAANTYQLTCRALKISGVNPTGYLA